MRPVTLSIPARILDVGLHGEEEEKAYAEAMTAAREEVMKEFAEREAQLAAHVKQEQTALTQCRTALSEAVTQMQELREDLVREIEDKALDLGLAIARKVLMQELSQQTYDINPIVQAALSQIPNRGQIKVFLNPGDLTRCMGEKSEKVDEDSRIEYLPDRTVPAGGCRVESAEGCVESSMETSVEKIADVLKEEQ